MEEQDNASTAKTDKTVVVSASRINTRLFFWESWSDKKRLIVFFFVIIVVLVAVSLGTYYLINRNSDPKITATQIISDESNYDDQAIKQFIIDNGGNPNYTSGQATTISDETNYETANALAISFTRLGDTGNALKAYEIAAAKLDTANKMSAYSFYDSYASAASSQNQRQLAIQNYLKAKEYFLQSEEAKNNPFFRNQTIGNIDASIKDLKNGTN